MQSGKFFMKLIIIIAALSLIALALAPIIPLIVPDVNGPDEQQVVQEEVDKVDEEEKLTDEETVGINVNVLGNNSE